MFGKGLLTGLGITAKHTFEREITQQYPEQRPHLPDRFRGSLAYEYPKCIACGLCIKACPNDVLTLNTYKDEGSRKKKVDSYIIDLQYCLYCNLCVEICPTQTLYFSHEFELATYKREGIKKIYRRPPESVSPLSDSMVKSTESDQAPPSGGDEEKLRRQVEAIRAALLKNPAKTLGKILPAEADVAIMTELLQGDDKILSKLAQLLAEDRTRAARVAAAWVKKARDSGSSPGVASPVEDAPPEPAAESSSSGGTTAPPESVSLLSDSMVRSTESDQVPPSGGDEEKLRRQVEAIRAALLKNPAKTLGKILPAEADVAIMTELLQGDDKILSKLAQLLAEDRTRAARVAAAWVKKARGGGTSS